MYLDIKCTRCGRTQVRQPLKKDLQKPIILVRCDFCGKYSRYNLVNHQDGSNGYYLSKWGRGKDDIVKVRRGLRRDQIHFTSAEIRYALDKIYGGGV